MLEVCVGKKRNKSKLEKDKISERKCRKWEDTKVPRVKEFKYLGSTVQESGGCEREVKKVQARWNGWRKV